MKRSSHQKIDQQGLVSIIVTLIIMAVLSLIVIGFAQLARQEQRRSLDRQLSTQAQFAAESGINSARNAIKGASAFTGDLTDCNAYNALSAADKAKFGSLDLNDNTKVTCLLLKQGQIELLYGNVGADQSQSIPLNGSQAIDSVTIKWKNTAGSTSPVPTSTKFPPKGTWSSGLGVLRIELVPLNGFSRASLSSGRRVLFAYPEQVTATPEIAYGAINGATPVLGGNCGTSANCQVKITGLLASFPGLKNYYLRVKSIYASSNLTVCVNDCAGTELRNAQVSVDSTGKAQDVIKRINARIPARPETGDLYPEYVLESIDSVCKRLTVMPDVTDITQTPSQIVNKSQNDCAPDTN